MAAHLSAKAVVSMLLGSACHIVSADIKSRLSLSSFVFWYLSSPKLISPFYYVLAPPIIQQQFFRLFQPSYVLLYDLFTLKHYLGEECTRIRDSTSKTLVPFQPPPLPPPPISWLLLGEVPRHGKRDERREILLFFSLSCSFD